MSEQASQEPTFEQRLAALTLAMREGRILNPIEAVEVASATFLPFLMGEPAAPKPAAAPDVTPAFDPGADQWQDAPASGEQRPDAGKPPRRPGKPGQAARPRSV